MRRIPFALGDSLAIAGAALVAYVLLAAPTFLGDGPELLIGCAYGHLECSNHVLFLRTVGRLARVLAGMGIPLFDAFELLSALGASLAVLCAHRSALVLGLTRGQAALTALLCATSPGWVLYSGVIEMPGPFLAFVGLALLMQAWLGVRGGIGRAALAGMASGFAQGVHTTGSFLIPIAAVMWLLGRTDRPSGWLRVLVREVGVLACAHVAMLALAVRVLAPQFPLVGLLQHSTLGQVRSFYPGGFSALAESFALEGVVPFGACVPMLVWLWLRGRARLVVTALGLVLILLLGFTGWVIWGAPGDAPEYGSYLLPLMVPLAGLLVRELPTKTALFLVLVGTSMSACERHVAIARPSHALTDAAVSKLIAGGPVVVLVESQDEIVPVVRRSPRSKGLRIDYTVMYAQTFDRLRAIVDSATDPSHTLSMPLFVTARALHWLEACPHPAAQRFVKEHLPAAYLLAEVEGSHGAVFAVRRRP